VKLGYKAWFESREEVLPSWWWKPLWKHNFPTRCKITLWLALNNKLLTWDNGQKRGWCGPNRCPLCKETLKQSLICSSLALMQARSPRQLKKISRLRGRWNNISLEECYRAWIQDRFVSLYARLSGILVSNIWWARNNAIFKDNIVPPDITVTITINMASEYKEDPTTQKKICPIPPTIDPSYPWGFFDGACQGHPPRCGVGVVMYLSSTHYIHIRYAPGGGTNSRAELTALWTLLEAAKEKSIRTLQVFGDSKIVIDWAMGKASIQNQLLETIMRDIKLNFRAFENMYFLHTMCEYNTKADSLSKEALELPTGAYGYYEFDEGNKIEAMEYRL
jgi:ribonuclease HI